MFAFYFARLHAYRAGRKARYADGPVIAPLCYTEAMREQWHQGWFDADLEIELVA